MARKPMVTRTITTTEATCMVVDTVNAEISNITVVCPRTYKDEKKLLAVCKAIAETEELKVVQVVATKEVEELYGMEEADFIKVAKKLPPRSKAELEAEADEQ